MAVLDQEVEVGAIVQLLGGLGASPAGTHAVLVLDRAGWHVSESLNVPPNLTLIHPHLTAPSSTRWSECGSISATAG